MTLDQVTCLDKSDIVNQFSGCPLLQLFRLFMNHTGSAGFNRCSHISDSLGNLELVGLHHVFALFNLPAVITSGPSFWQEMLVHKSLVCFWKKKKNWDLSHEIMRAFIDVPGGGCFGNPPELLGFVFFHMPSGFEVLCPAHMAFEHWDAGDLHLGVHNRKYVSTTIFSQTEWKRGKFRCGDSSTILKSRAC